MSVGADPIAVVALGGNALLPRGASPDARTQLTAARGAAALLTPAAERFRLVVTHGNGPQVGLLALMGEAYEGVDPYPLDVLDAESEGQIGYVVELALDNSLESRDTVTLITRVVVDEDDLAFATPTKFIGPVYEQEAAHELKRARGWSVKGDGGAWRRVVPSPEPRRIVQLPAIRQLVDSGFVVVCAGGGGVPVIEEDGSQRGVEAVIDKDLCSALLATELGANVLVLATDVAGVFLDWGEPEERPIGETTPEELRRHDFADGSMGPKVEAACRFVESSGGRGVIGALAELDSLLDGTAGTQVTNNGGNEDE